VKLHSPAFEKTLRRDVKAKIRSSPELKREYRKAKKGFRRHRGIQWFIRPIWSGFIGFVVWGIIKDTGQLAPGLAIINLVTFFTLGIFAQTLLHTLYRATDLPALAILPVSERTIFYWELQKFFKRHGFFSMLDQAAGFMAVGISEQFLSTQWVVTGIFAALSWLMLLALTALCAARLPRFPYQKITSTFILCGFALLVGHKFIGHAVENFIVAAAPVLNLISPTGWVPLVFQAMLPGGSWLAIALLAPVILAISMIRNSLVLLESRLQFKEQTIPQVADVVPRARAGHARRGEDANQTQRLGLTEIEEIIQSRQFLLHEEPKGWFEERLWQWFTSREKTLAEFSFPKGIQITRPWWLILRNFLLMLGIGFTLGMVDMNFEYWTFGIGLFITLSQGLLQMCLMGNAFRGMFNSGVLIPIYAAYPITFRDLSGILFKLSVIQLPLFVLYAMSAGLLIGHLVGLDFISGIIDGLKAGFLIFAGRFVLTIFAFSAGTNDSSRFRLRTIGLIVLVIGGVLLFMLLGSAGLFVPNMLAGWLLCLAAMFDAYAMFRIYCWFYNANRFDLMSLPRR
jgi:hypothetical protein